MNEISRAVRSASFLASCALQASQTSLLISQSVPVYSFVADALSSLPNAPHPTNLSERNVTQNFASLDFQASYALFSSVISATFVGPGEAVLSGVSSAFALFASTFP